MLLSGKARIPRMAKSMNQMHNLMISPAGNGGKVNPRSDRSGQQAGDGCRENLGCSSPAGTSLLQTGWAVETTAGGQNAGPGLPVIRDMAVSPESLFSRATRWTLGRCNIQSPHVLCDCLLNACPQNWHPDSLKSPLQTPNVKHLNP